MQVSGQGRQQRPGGDAGAANTSLNACHMEQELAAAVKFLGSYTIPQSDVQLGASFQSIPGVEYAAQYAAANATCRGGVCGRPRPSAGGRRGDGHDHGQPDPAPGSFYGPRFNQIDARLGKVIRFETAAPWPSGPVQHPQLGHDLQRERALLFVARAGERRGAPADEGVADVSTSEHCDSLAAVNRSPVSLEAGLFFVLVTSVAVRAGLQSSVFGLQSSRRSLNSPLHCSSGSPLRRVELLLSPPTAQRPTTNDKRPTIEPYH